MSQDQLHTVGLSQNYVTISAFPGGFITLPEKSFIAPCDPNMKRTVPSLAFLITHPGLQTSHSADSKVFRFMFDLGLRSKAADYTPQQRLHLQNRVPYTLGPSIENQLHHGGLSAERDIDLVLLSHVHYDHHGDPENFTGSDFIVGHGSLDILKHGLKGMGAHQHFQSSLLPVERTFELPASNDENATFRPQLRSGICVAGSWHAMGPFPSVMDIFGDSSVYVVDSPGHLPGHINLLCRVAPHRWVYLGGDACHDTRLLTGEKEISTWRSEDGLDMCIHLDKSAAEETLNRITQLEKILEDKVEVIMAHDWEWLLKNKDYCFPKILRF